MDGVFLALHGAMILEDQPDAESEIVRRVRALLKPGTPIAVSLDLHGHITAAMIQPDVAYIGYREFPHIDMYETGYRAARLLIDWINGKVKPVMALSKRHMVFSPNSARTGVPPLADIVAEGRAMEARGEVLHVSLFPVQPWIDTPDLGFAALVCGESKEAAQSAADTVGQDGLGPPHGIRARCHAAGRDHPHRPYRRPASPSPAMPATRLRVAGLGIPPPCWRRCCMRAPTGRSASPSAPSVMPRPRPRRPRPAWARRSRLRSGTSAPAWAIR